MGACVWVCRIGCKIAHVGPGTSKIIRVRAGMYLTYPRYKRYVKVGLSPLVLLYSTSVQGKPIMYYVSQAFHMPSDLQYDAS